MGLIKYVGSILLFTMFVFAIIGLSTNFANDNSAIVDLNEDATYSTLSSDLNKETLHFAKLENASNKAFAEIEIEGSGQTTPTGGQFKKRITSPGNMTRLILTSIRTKTFGGDTNFGIVITALFSFLIMVGVFYVWKLWAGRNPD